MIEWLSNLENSILIWITQTTSNSFFDSLFPIYTDIHKIQLFFAPICLLILLIYIKTYRKAGVIYFAILLLTIGISDFTGKCVKDYFRRPRPFTVPELNITQKSPAGAKNSFYSNHASNTFAFAAYTSQFFPAARVVVFPIATLTAYSRMYTGVHYPSDVLAGGIMGSLIGWFLSRLARKLVERKKL